MRLSHLTCLSIDPIRGHVRFRDAVPSWCFPSLLRLHFIPFFMSSFVIFFSVV